MSKRILFISPIYFNYYKKLIASMEKQGYTVDFFCDRPVQNSLFKAISRVSSKLVYPMATYYSNKITKKCADVDYDYIFLIAGMSFSFSENTMKHLRNLHPNAVFVMYQWDSVANLPYCRKIWKYFDRIYSFDRVDTAIYEKLSFLPLFYTDEYRKNNEVKYELLYDYSYIGTAHPQKFTLIEKMVSELNEKKKNGFVFHYMPSKLKFIYHKLTDTRFKGYGYEKFKSKPLNENEVIQVYNSSGFILDAPQDNQNGATIRTIECLGSKIKLVTCNEDIINYDFYRPENIYIYEGRFDFNNIFFNSDYIELPEALYEKYSIDNWVAQVLDLKVKSKAEV